MLFLLTLLTQCSSPHKEAATGAFMHAGDLQGAWSGHRTRLAPVLRRSCRSSTLRLKRASLRLQQRMHSGLIAPRYLASSIYHSYQCQLEPSIILLCSTSELPQQLRARSHRWRPHRAVGIPRGFSDHQRYSFLCALLCSTSSTKWFVLG